MNHSCLDSRLRVMAPMATSKIGPLNNSYISQEISISLIYRYVHREHLVDQLSRGPIFRRFRGMP